MPIRNKSARTNGAGTHAHRRQEEIFEIDIDEDDVDTVYGLLTKLLGRVPIVGSTAVTEKGLRLTAVDSAGRPQKSVHHRGGTGPRRGRGRN